MRKAIYILLAFILLPGLFGCVKNSSVPPAGTVNTDDPVTAEPDEEFVWTREGYFSDEDGNFVYISASEDEENPGWYVGGCIGEDTYGWYIGQEGKTLHGNIAAPYEEEGTEFYVTVSEDGEQDILLEVNGGETYRLACYEMEEASITVYLNTEGWGEIAYAPAREELVFDDEYPAQSGYIGLAEPETFILGARPDEGYKFVKWTKDGEDFSRDAEITVELAESAEYVAVFWIKGTNEAHVDLDTVDTLGDVLGLPNWGTGGNADRYVYVFEQDEVIYRAIAESNEDTFNALFDLDWDDPQYAEKERAILSPLPVLTIENLSEQIPTQAEMDRIIGKNGGELLDDGWTLSGWNLQDMQFYMNHGFFSYLVTMEGEAADPDEFEDEDIRPFVVTAVSYQGFGDTASLDED